MFVCLFVLVLMCLFVCLPGNYSKMSLNSTTPFLGLTGYAQLTLVSVLWFLCIVFFIGTITFVVTCVIGAGRGQEQEQQQPAESAAEAAATNKKEMEMT